MGDAVTWKQDYLELKTQIEQFTARHLQGIAEFRPPPNDPSLGNVARLLFYHLEQARNLLFDEVNGGLDETYQEEVNRLLGP